MGAGSVKITIEGEGANAVRAYTELVNIQRKVKRGAKEIGAETERAARRGRRALGETRQEASGLSGAFGRLGRDAKTWALGLTGVGGVLAGMRQIRQEFDNILERQRRAGATQRTASQAAQEVIRNLPGKSAAEISSTLGQLDVIAAERGVSIPVVRSAGAAAFSAGGGNITTGLAAVELATRSLPERPEAIPELAGAIQDIQGAVGFKDPRAALGFVQTIGGLSRITDPALQNRNIPSAVQGGVAQGFSGQQTGAFFAAGSVAAKESQGRKTRTFTINFLRQLRENKRVSRATRGQDLAGIIRTLQQDPRLGQRFLRDASFEAQFSGPVKQLLTDPESQFSQQFFANLGQFPDEEGLIQKAERTLEFRNVDPAERNQRFARTAATIAERAELGDPRGAQVGEARTGFQRILQAQGVSFIGQQAERARFEVAAETGGDLGEFFRGRALAARGPTRIPSFTLGGLGFGGATLPATEAGIKLGESLDRLADALDRNREAVEAGGPIEGRPADDTRREPGP